MDMNQYLDIFIDEAKEHLQTLNDQLLIIESEPENKDCINEIFRAAHSLKGMSGTMGYKRMQRLTHDMENVFSEVRNEKLKVTAGLVDVLFQASDALEGYLANIVERQDEGDNDNEPIIQELNRILEEGLGATPEAGGADGGSGEPEHYVIREHYSEIPLGDSEKRMFEEAYQMGMNVFGITVYLERSCMLKAARAFLVVKAMEELGDILSMMPDVTALENDDFGYDFSYFIVTSHPLDTVIGRVKNVLEIETALGGDYRSMVRKQESSAKKEQAARQIQEANDARKSEERGEAQKGESRQGGAKAARVGSRTFRVDIEKLDSLMNQVSELIIAKNSLVATSRGWKEAGEKARVFYDQIEYLERITTNIHESVMKVRMVPIESVVHKFPRMIRDLQKKLGKEMTLYVTGEDTELDRSVIDEIGDPLMHLLRNAADHGLETAEVRQQRGKPKNGSIFLDAYQDGNNIVIEVRDDGNGIDVDGVRRKAVGKGLITEEQGAAMGENEIISLLFHPGFSTSEKVSEISGRGVGLDVVKSRIESLGGDVEVRSVLGEGSRWIVRLPLTLAIIQALMVEVGKEKYAISLGSIMTIEDVPVEEIRYVGSKEVIHLRGRVIPIVRMQEVLELPPREDDESLVVIIVKKGDRQLGLVVDELIGQQEIVIKSLGKYLSGNRTISGATILGDGEVALILDVNALF